MLSSFCGDSRPRLSSRAKLDNFLPSPNALRRHGLHLVSNSFLFEKTFESGTAVVDSVAAFSAIH
jgi:hypothetical protein